MITFEDSNAALSFLKLFDVEQALRNMTRNNADIENFI